MANRKYLPTFAELIDRMTICQLKSIFIPDNKEAYDEEISDIKYDLDQIIKEKDVDIVMLDMGAPAQAVPGAYKALKPGGFIVGYCPTVEQVVKFKNSLTKFSNIIVREIIERIWEAGGDMSRPKTAPIGHTAFLIFARKI